MIDYKIEILKHRNKDRNGYIGSPYYSLLIYENKNLVDSFHSLSNIREVSALARDYETYYKYFSAETIVE
jgi:hypothetical protein